MSKFAVLVILLFISGTYLAIVSGSQWAFYLYQIVYFLNPENRWWSEALPTSSTITYSFITVLLLFVTFAFNAKKYNLNKLSSMPQFKWLVLLTIFYCLAYFYAVSPERHTEAMIDFIKMLLVLSVGYKILDSEKKLEWALLVYVIGSAYIGYEAYAVGRNSGDRVEGIGLIDAPEANGTAAAIVAAIPLIIYFLWWSNRKVKFAMLLLGPFIANGLILINSRGAFLGLLIGLVHFMWTMFFSRFKFEHQRKVSIAILLLGISGALYLVDEGFIDRMATLTTPEDEEASGSHRVHIWTATFDLLEDHPLGVGAYGFEILSRQYVDEELFFNGQRRKAVHSIWFQALAEVGWQGLIAFLLVVITTYISLARVKKRCVEVNNHRLFYLSHTLQSAFITLLVTSTFINQFRVQIVYWLIFFAGSLYSIVVVNNRIEVHENVSKENKGSHSPQSNIGISLPE